MRSHALVVSVCSGSAVGRGGCEAAERLSVNGRSIRRLVAARRVPAVQIDGPGSAPASPLEALEAWLWADGDEAA